LTGPRNKDSGLRNGDWGLGSGVARGANWADRRAKWPTAGCHGPCRCRDGMPLALKTEKETFPEISSRTTGGWVAGVKEFN